MLDQALEALKTYDWGSDLAPVKAIDEAILSSADDGAARSELEKALAAVLDSDASRDAKDVVCRRLMQIGTAACVPALAKCLTDENLSHMARYALERIQAPEAAKSLRDALDSVSGNLKVGVIGSLGARKDADSAAQLAPLLGDSDTKVARAAAIALGDIQTVTAAKALGTAKPSDESVKIAAVDGSLACAEAMLAEGNKGEAMKLYKGLLANSPAKHVKLAVTRGMLACAGK
ncbi:hypothetical protein CA13_04790 [Planctomycetes bacterium CA13]|uniref:HEAT repeat protein n=1 Tax=Novipirellula herctigrandis TaxID=2527986 RepID=A0A5C5YVK4_9BACT|nr:hypothetical protein CA13_04790 [Planctomycetes bacterium CA13]